MGAILWLEPSKSWLNQPLLSRRVFAGQAVAMTEEAFRHMFVIAIYGPHHVMGAVLVWNRFDDQRLTFA